MPEITIERETEAIKTVLTALEPLSIEIRTNVLEYVVKRLGVTSSAVKQSQQPLSQTSSPAVAAPSAQGAAQIHIREFKEQKRPHSASEMAALVAYYLENLAPPKERTDKINTKLVETYFKIAEFPLPTKTKFTLPNAKSAGYLDAVGDGEYKLNAVGHNLIVHSLPRDKEGKTKARSSKRRKRSRNGR